MKLIVVIACVLASISSAWAESKLTCLDKGKLRYRKFGNMVTEEVAICFDKSSVGDIESPNCAKKNCGNVSVTDKKAINSKFGTPGFHTCRAAGGEPQIMEYFDGTNWIPTDRCIFKNDNSFINTTRLLAH